MSEAIKASDFDSLLSITEHVKIILSVSLPETESANGEAASLAVLGNTTSGIYEEGCICLCTGQSQAILTIKAVAISANLRINTTQIASAVSGERASFAVTFSDASPGGSSVSCILNDGETLQDLLKEVRRLMEIAENNNITLQTCLKWMHRFDTPGSQAVLSRSPSSARKQLISSPRKLRVKPAHDEDQDSIQDAVRTSFLNRQLASRKDEYTETLSVNLSIVSWNVASQAPSEEACSWLGRFRSSDLVIIGLQEMDLSADALLRYTPAKQIAWQNALKKALNQESQAELSLVEAKQLVGVLLLVFARYPENIGACEMSEVAVGNLGFANKGAVACHLRVHDTSVVFANCHLAAFENMHYRRNEDFNYISQNCHFPLATDLDNYMLVPPEMAKTLPSGSIFHSHHLFVFGDLNYRVELANSEVRKRLAEGKHESLLAHDQLNQEKAKGVFKGFQEGEISFPPTYRYDMGKSVYDTSEKQRTPSFTDRILWFQPIPEEGSEKDENQQNKNALRQTEYSSCAEAMLSDHRPVFASFEMPTEKVNITRRAEVRREIIYSLDKFENENQPRVKIRPSSTVAFPQITYLEASTQSLTIENVGGVAAEMRFSPTKPDTPEIAPFWLHINPKHALLLPGESTTVTFSIAIDNSNVAAMNASEEDVISELLILSLTNGRDIFIQVTTKGYLPTFFGCPLTMLNRTSSSITQLDPSDRIKLLKDSTGHRQRQIPEELQKMTGFLVKHGMHLEDLFLTPANQKLVNKLRKALDSRTSLDMAHLLSDEDRPDYFGSSTGVDTSNPVSEAEAEQDMGNLSLDLTPGAQNATLSPEDALTLAMGDLLLKWLEALPNPVITYELYSRALHAEEKEGAYKVLVALPEDHQTTFMHIAAFLKTFLAQTQHEATSNQGSRIDRLAVVFSNVMIRPDPSNFAAKSIIFSAAKRKRFFRTFLVD